METSITGQQLYQLGERSPYQVTPPPPVGQDMSMWFLLVGLDLAAGPSEMLNACSGRF